MCQVKRHFSVSVSISGSYDCVCASFFSIHIFFLLRLHLYYSHAIYRIKYSSLTFPIRFKACYFYVFTFVVVVVVVVASKAIHKKWPSIDKKNDSREMAQKKMSVRPWREQKIISIIFGALEFAQKAIENGVFYAKTNICSSHAHSRRVKDTYTAYKLKNMYYWWQQMDLIGRNVLYLTTNGSHMLKLYADSVS